MSDWKHNEEIEIFREYLRIPTVHPDIDYTKCVEFLKEQASSLDMPCKVYYPAKENKPVVLMSWIGLEPSLPSIVLNSHMDVVPVFPEMWTHPPFAAEMDDQGRIFARGSQDMKCVGMQYLAAIRALKNAGKRLKRTLHVLFVPDEEIGGHDGMGAFVQLPDFKDLNVGFALDEGYASTNDVFNVFYAERSIWHLTFKIGGKAGHGSLLLADTVGEKFHYILSKMMELRRSQIQRMQLCPELTLGDVTSVNLTKVHAGVQNNVIPAHLEASFDIRVSTMFEHEYLEKMIRGWCEEAGGNIELEFEQKEPKVKPTVLDDSNVFWGAFKRCMQELKLKTKTQIFPAGTDSRFLRELDIPAIGFSPMINTALLLHDHDEHLKASVYLDGIDIYKHLITQLANV